jgi:20S proteasome subunit beta 2
VIASSFNSAWTSQKNQLPEENDVISKLSEKNTLKTGTTIVGVCCIDGVILAADTRATGGSFIADKQKEKVHQLSINTYCCGAGTSADCDQITRYLRHKLAFSRMSDDSLSHEDLDLYHAIPVWISQYLKMENRRKPECVLILGTVSNDIPLVMEFAKDFSCQKVAYTAMGSGSMDALSVLEKAFRNITCDNNIISYLDQNNNCFINTTINDNVIDIVRRAVLAGIMNDLGSGSHVDICVIRGNHNVSRWREISPYHLIKTTNNTSEHHFKLNNSISTVWTDAEIELLVSPNIERTTNIRDILPTSIYNNLFQDNNSKSNTFFIENKIQIDMLDDL